ncbi:hypothetical protein K502DRAFT_334788 [Neoconidiobolus thromboides FSU 785]|nr:hypothetical protein K502DRAFT_334788 [Neoconidiobolus thromboides FSU 785]
MSFFGLRNFGKSRAKKNDSPSSSPTLLQYPLFSQRSSQSNSNETNAASSKLLYLTPPFVTASLVKGNFKPIVALPKFIDLDEWLASNMFDFFFYLNMFYGTLSDFCTPKSCPVMSADAGIEYAWIDSNKKTHRIPASQHIDLVMTSLQQTINDESIFPTKAGAAFPSNFKNTISNLAKQIFRVYAHLFHAHYPTILHLSSEGHFNSQFAHFIAFSKEFQLLNSKDFTPLAELITELEANGMF